MNGLVETLHMSDHLMSTYGGKRSFMGRQCPCIVQDPDWKARESAVLALGAIAEGCQQGLMPYLSGIINMMLPMLRDPRPMVRIITCWSLTRYSHWVLIGQWDAVLCCGSLMMNISWAFLTSTKNE
jgi:hypothetical protein